MRQELTTPPRRLWTIGHSTRSGEELLALLQRHDIQRLIDIRRYPGSRRYPHFHSVALAKNLPMAGLSYEEMPMLGGRRTARADSPNNGWKNASFRGYADYMQTEEFDRALDELMAHGKHERTAIMCAEAVPWRCHRSLVADALVAHGWEVTHILSAGHVKQHRLTAFAIVRSGHLLYPAPSEPSATLRMF
ncbi:MAG: DUF488 domain-containing protein [Nitrospira sp.]|nr:DUF488 domain-containing protein [Nitrospira sp.]MBS0173195.1 DUF488 domain-containing protein [Nitrospira sp.]MBS0177477.1 DUF488 domain-containing protein [Nitrospira sp.]MBX3339604.1 DUF488 domain-containing protein [Nitrospira sp.]MCW5779611.1 DUF488 domain-containing protein [Nitrospira sp.]